MPAAGAASGASVSGSAVTRGMAVPLARTTCQDGLFFDVGAPDHGLNPSCRVEGRCRALASSSGSSAIHPDLTPASARAT